MAIIPLFRVIIFILISLFSLVVLGICAHIEYLVAGYTDLYLSFAPFGLGAACLTTLSLPVLLVLGNLRHRVFTSMILFEIIWFFILWILWGGTAGDTVAGKAYHFPAGCVYDHYPMANQICHEFTVVEVFAFLNFFCAFIYYDVIFLYAIINAIRGKGIWTASVKDAATGTSGAVNFGAPMVQPRFNAAPAIPYQNCKAYPSNVPLTQPYSAYPQQVPPQGPPAQPHTAYLQQAPPQGPPPQQYNAYQQQVSPYALPIVPPGQNQPYNYSPPPGALQQHINHVGYSPSPTTNNAPLPPQPNYNSYPVNSSQVQLSLPSEYQGQPIPPQQQLPSQSPYGFHQTIPV